MLQYRSVKGGEAGRIVPLGKQVKDEASRWMAKRQIEGGRTLGSGAGPRFSLLRAERSR